MRGWERCDTTASLSETGALRIFLAKRISYKLLNENYCAQ